MLAAMAFHDSTPCTVRTPDGQFDGLLIAWQYGPTGWRGYVEYSLGVGRTYLGWFPEADLHSA